MPTLSSQVTSILRSHSARERTLSTSHNPGLFFDFFAGLSARVGPSLTTVLGVVKGTAGSAAVRGFFTGGSFFLAVFRGCGAARLLLFLGPPLPATRD